MSKTKIIITVLAFTLTSFTSYQPHTHKALPVTTPAYLRQFILIKPLATTVDPVAPLALAAYPVAPQGTYHNGYAFGNCTWYVAGRIRVPETWGNANTWASRARADGQFVSSSPFVGTIAASSAGYFGHVAIVEAVEGDMVLVDEMNVQGLDAVDSAWYPASFFDAYIYV